MLGILVRECMVYGCRECMGIWCKGADGVEDVVVYECIGYRCVWL